MSNALRYPGHQLKYHLQLKDRRKFGEVRVETSLREVPRKSKEVRFDVQIEDLAFSILRLVIWASLTYDTKKYP